MVIYIHGSFMNDNFGDYLIFNKLEEEIKNIAPQSSTIYANLDRSYNKYNKVEVENIYKAIRKADMIVLAGGGYLGEPDYRKWYWSINFLKEHAMPFIYIMLSGKRYAILGTGVGPVSCMLPRKIIKKIIDRASLVSVRDIESKQYIEKWGIKRVINVIPDWVMAYDKKKLVCTENSTIYLLNKKRDEGYTIVLIHITTIRNAKSRNIIFQCLNKFIENRKNIFFVVSPDQGNKKQYQRACNNAKLLPKEITEIISYNNPWDLSSIINTVDVVITDKLHVGVVATRLYKKVISVPAHSKTKRFHKQVNNSNCILLDELNDCKFMELLNSAFTNEVDCENIDKIVMNASDNIEVLKEFIFTR